MRSTLAVLAFALAASAAAPASADTASDELAALKTAAKCSDPASPFRVWCIATDFGKGTAPELPKGKHFVGLTIYLEPGNEADALTNHVSPGSLTISEDGAKAKVTYLTPSNDGEKQMLAEAVANLAVLMKGKSKTAKLPPDLAGYVRTLKADHPATKVGGEWTFAGDTPARMRKVGAYWVTVETGAKGVYASIFTDAWE